MARFARYAVKQQCRVSDIYKALGCAPKCGKCVPLVKELSRAEATVAADSLKRRPSQAGLKARR